VRGAIEKLQERDDRRRESFLQVALRDLCANRLLGNAHRVDLLFTMSYCPAGSRQPAAVGNSRTTETPYLACAVHHRLYAERNHPLGPGLTVEFG
jgi:hypothetical protein